jgi:hypothetical protein
VPEIVIVAERDPRRGDGFEPHVSASLTGAGLWGDDDSDAGILEHPAQFSPRVAVIDNDDLDFDVHLAQDRPHRLRELEWAIEGGYHDTN